MTLIGRYPERRDIKVPTIFDNKKYRSIHLHVPVYDKDAFPEYRSIGILRAIDDPNYRKTYEKGCLQEFMERKNEVMDVLKRKSWDLCMQYFFLLDGIQHVFLKIN